MRFDTRDKKPKVYNILFLTAAVGAAVVLMLKEGIGAAAVSIVVDLYFAAVIALLLIAFYKQLQYNPYSYNTIFYIGIALFLFSVLLANISVTFRIIRWPDLYDEESILSILLGTAKSYMLFSFPFIFLFSGALCVSNISLIRHEGRRLVNILGIILSFIMVAGALLLFRIDFFASGSQREVMIHDLLTNLYASVYLYFECMLIGAIVADAIASLYMPEYDKDFIIILGCGIRKDGTPSPLLRGRIDMALDFARRQKEETGKDIIFVTSGGQGPNEVISESAPMKAYLLSQGVPEERIIEEDRSTSTFENMKFSKEKIWAVDPSAKIAFSTTNYHVFRSGLFARRVKMRAQGMGAKTKWYFWPNAAVREFVGLLTKHRIKQAAILGGMIAIYTVLTLMVYR